MTGKQYQRRFDRHGLGAVSSKGTLRNREIAGPLPQAAARQRGPVLAFAAAFAIRSAAMLDHGCTSTDGRPTRLTSAPGAEFGPDRSPDGEQLTYVEAQSHPTGGDDHERRRNGARPVKPLGNQFVPSWQPTGSRFGRYRLLCI